MEQTKKIPCVEASGVDPVAIGGVGGSGTRLVAKLIRQCGTYLGSDINESEDCLWFTLLFKRIGVLKCSDAEFACSTQALVAGLAGGQPFSAEMQQWLMSLAAVGRSQHPADWLALRSTSLIAAAAGPEHALSWGWKEPNTHIVIERLWLNLPKLRYVHVVRNGIDMAFSHNQNQLRLWGPTVLGEDGPLTPRRSLAYWCRVHHRMQALADVSEGRFYWLDYDLLCRYPKRELLRLQTFLGCTGTSLADFRQQVVKPMVRERPLGNQHFDAADLAYVHSMGYS